MRFGSVGGAGSVVRLDSEAALGSGKLQKERVLKRYGNGYAILRADVEC